MNHTETQAMCERLNASNDARDWQVADALTRQQEKIGRLTKALEPFANHAEAWTRMGFDEDSTLVESCWEGGPAADFGEPEYLEATFIRVRHLVAARAALQAKPYCRCLGICEAYAAGRECPNEQAKS